ncbi:ribonuclease HII, partial [Microbacterium sp. RD02]|nr:ribonuclease HII [Microbacterium sp. RD02]
MTVIAPRLTLERKLLGECDLIIALDEVGRGALAGPVAVGAAVMDAKGARRRVPEGLRDSKLVPEPGAPT